MPERARPLPAPGPSTSSLLRAKLGLEQACDRHPFPLVVRNGERVPEIVGRSWLSQLAPHPVPLHQKPTPKGGEAVIVIVQGRSDFRQSTVGVARAQKRHRSPITCPTSRFCHGDSPQNDLGFRKPAHLYEQLTVSLALEGVRRFHQLEELKRPLLDSGVGKLRNQRFEP